jgi:hypothetical protein
VSGVTTVLVLADITPVDGPDSALPARLCASINLIDPAPPLAIVAHGDLALLLPAIALAQRSAHRRTAEYLLVDPVLPAATDAWPDAPVTVACDPTSDASIQGRLRGWTVITLDEAPTWLPAD